MERHARRWPGRSRCGWRGRSPWARWPVTRPRRPPRCRLGLWAARSPHRRRGRLRCPCCATAKSFRCGWRWVPMRCRPSRCGARCLGPRLAISWTVASHGRYASARRARCASSNVARTCFPKSSPTAQTAEAWARSSTTTRWTLSLAMSAARRPSSRSSASVGSRGWPCAASSGSVRVSESTSHAVVRRGSAGGAISATAGS